MVDKENFFIECERSFIHLINFLNINSFFLNNESNLFKINLEFTNINNDKKKKKKNSLLLFNKEQYNEFIRLLKAYLKDILNEFILNEFQSQLYRELVCLTELERFKEEEEFSKPIPYNLTAKYRPSLIDKIIDKIDRNYLTFLIDKLIENIGNFQKNEENFELDDFNFITTNNIPFNYKRNNLEIDLLVLIIFTFIIDNTIGESEQIFKKFIITKFDYSEFNKGVNYFSNDFLKDTNFPYIIELNNQFVIYYRFNIYKTTNIIDTILWWLKIVCEDNNFLGVFPIKSLVANFSLIKIYTLFFSKNKEEIKLLEGKINETPKERPEFNGLPEINKENIIDFS